MSLLMRKFYQNTFGLLNLLLLNMIFDICPKIYKIFQEGESPCICKCLEGVIQKILAYAPPEHLPLLPEFGIPLCRPASKECAQR